METGDSEDKRKTMQTATRQRGRLGRSRSSNREDMPGKGGKSETQKKLVDSNLLPSAEEQRDIIIASQIGDAHRRAIAVFMGSDDVAQVEKFMPKLLGNVFLECLTRFVHSRGAQVVWSARFERECLSAVQRTVRVDGESRQFLCHGQLFIYSEHERIVVSAVPDDYNPVVAIHVHSDKDPVAFFGEWEEFAKENSYLQGRPFFADGEPIDSMGGYTWDTIVLPEKVTQAIRIHVQGFLDNCSHLKGFGVKPRRGLILAGPPGTGKTHLGKILANTLGVSFIWVTPRHIRDARSFKAILSVARFMSPTVVFLEDLDLFGEGRERGGGMGLGELMNQLDGGVENDGIITIATTNRLAVVEAALRNRPGRFDRVVTLDAMEEGGRRELLVQLLEKAEVAETDLAYLVEKSKGYTGAQVQELVNTLYLLALQNRGVEANTVVEDIPIAGHAKEPSNPTVSITKSLLDAAMDDFQVEQKSRIGFCVT